MNHIQQIRVLFAHRNWLAALLAVSLLPQLATPTYGVVVGDFEVLVAESPRFLEAVLKFNRGQITQSQLNVIRDEESCKNPSIRLHDRNRPAIMVINKSAQANQLTQFVIDIQQTGYDFGVGDIATDGFNSQPVMKSDKSDAGVGATGVFGTDHTQLVVNLTGLAAGMAAIFRVDLDPVPVVDTLFPDYRAILLGGDAGNGPTAPSLISATFAMAGMPDRKVPPQEWQGNFSGPITGAGTLEVYHLQTVSEMFGTDGGIGVPEPASLAMMAMCGICLVGLGRKRLS